MQDGKKKAKGKRQKLKGVNDKGNTFILPGFGYFP
jgi:hypothetical protein